MATATEKVVTLRELPITVNVTKMAAGIIGMMDENERAALRFGMLPAKKMEILEKGLREKFDSIGQHPREVEAALGLGGCVTDPRDYTEDSRVSYVGSKQREWNIGRLVKEAAREITLGIYASGELVV